MNLINTQSLAETVDNLNEALFFHQQMSTNDKVMAAQWLATRQGLRGAYANTFAPTDEDVQNGMQLFTGERLSNSAAFRHILGEETCRILRLLNVQDEAVQTSLEKATRGITEAVKREHDKGVPIGWFCCGRCTPAYWRHITAGGFENQEVRFADGMKLLAQHRDGKGAWKRFPFYWTLSALAEIDSSFTGSELKYIASRLEKVAKHKSDGKYMIRRRVLAERLLERL